MTKTKAWIKAIRIRTLPLSVAGILMGSFIAYGHGYWDNLIFWLAIATTLFFQILSNLANDFGDSKKGADNESRVGPMRAIQSGVVSSKEMLIAIVICSLFSLFSALLLIYFGVRGMGATVWLSYLVLAVLCIVAAITYTVGKKAYGYSGWGDVMVFLFFGVVSVVGVYPLFSKVLDLTLLLPAVTIGLLSVAVLNLNNMRDQINDAAVGKQTLVVKWGFKKSKKYHILLILVSFMSLTVFLVLEEWYLSLFSLFPFLVLFKHMFLVWKTEEPVDLDPELKKVALSTFFISVLFLITILLWS